MNSKDTLAQFALFGSMVSDSDVINLISMHTAPYQIDLAMKDGTPPVRYVQERFLGKGSEYSISVADDLSPCPKDRNYSPEEILEDAYKQAFPERGYSLGAIKNKAKIFIGKAKKNNIQIEEARLEDGQLIGYYAISPKDGKRTFCPVSFEFSVLSGELENYIDEMRFRVMHKHVAPAVKEAVPIIYDYPFLFPGDAGMHASEAIITGRNYQNISDSRLSFTEETKAAQNELKKEIAIISDGLEIESSAKSVEHLEHLITLGTKAEGGHLFEGQGIDKSSFHDGAERNILFDLFFKDKGSKRDSFFQWMSYAMSMEPDA